MVSNAELRMAWAWACCEAKVEPLDGDGDGLFLPWQSRLLLQFPILIVIVAHLLCVRSWHEIVALPAVARMHLRH